MTISIVSGSCFLQLKAVSLTELRTECARSTMGKKNWEVHETIVTMMKPRNFG